MVIFFSYILNTTKSDIADEVFVAAAAKISPLAALIMKVLPSKRHEQLAVIEYLRNQFVISEDGEDRAQKVKEKERQLVLEERKRKKSGEKQYFTDEAVLRNMVLHAWSVRKESDTFDKEAYDLALEKVTTGSDHSFYVWERMRNNLRRKLKEAFVSVLLTLKGDMTNKKNVLKDICLPNREDQKRGISKLNRSQLEPMQLELLLLVLLKMKIYQSTWKILQKMIRKM